MSFTLQHKSLGYIYSIIITQSYYLIFFYSTYIPLGRISNQRKEYTRNNPLDVPPLSSAIPQGEVFFYPLSNDYFRLYLYYMDLLEITKDFFKVPIREREKIILEIIQEVLIMIEVEQLPKDIMVGILEDSINKSNEKEYYEVSEVLTVVKKELEKINYGYGL